MKQLPSYGVCHSYFILCGIPDQLGPPALHDKINGSPWFLLLWFSCTVRSCIQENSIGELLLYVTKGIIVQVYATTACELPFLIPRDWVCTAHSRLRSLLDLHRLVVQNLRREFTHAQNFLFPLKVCTCADSCRNFWTTNLKWSVYNI